VRAALALLCWNVAGRVKRLPEQAELILAARPDVVCLQEVTPVPLPVPRALTVLAGTLDELLADPALTPVEDPSAYGLVRRDPDCAVSEFVEKPGPEQLDTNLINAGAYILEREVLGEMAPAGTNISIEREVFPALVGRGLFGYEARGYWLDIGTPERYLQATFDILEGSVDTEVGRRIGAAGRALTDGAEVNGRVVAPALLGAGCVIGDGAVVGARAVLGRGVSIGEGVRIEGSVALDGARVDAHSTVTGSIICPEASVGERCCVEHGVVLGAGVRLGPDNMLTAGARIFPGVELPAGAIRF